MFGSEPMRPATGDRRPVSGERRRVTGDRRPVAAVRRSAGCRFDDPRPRGTVGGMNIGERYERYWHDVMVSVQGPVLNDLYREYATNWTASGGTFPTTVARTKR